VNPAKRLSCHSAIPLTGESRPTPGEKLLPPVILIPPTAGEESSEASVNPAKRLSCHFVSC